MDTMKKTFLVLGLLLLPRLLPAWGLHNLVTELSLPPEQFPSLEEKIPSESLASFVRAEFAGLPKVFSDYYDWLATTGTDRFKRVAFTADSKNPERALLFAARMNTQSKFALIRRLPAGEPAHRRTYDLSKLSRHEKTPTEFSVIYVATENEKVPAREILATFADEPDWGFDRDLWNLTEYGYGAIPYGDEHGDSNAAAFHTWFHHENFVIRKFAPEVTHGMAHERLELFKRLAQFAHATHHPYWGYRFSAWAIHYAQDLTQPYHSKAVPGANLYYYLKFALSMEKARIKTETTQLVTNRHYLFEDYVKTLLSEAQKDKNWGPVRKALATGTVGENFLEEISRRAAEHAPVIDDLISRAYGRRANDPHYVLSADASYSIRDGLREITGEATPVLLEQTLSDLRLAGAATRSLLRAIH